MRPSAQHDSGWVWQLWGGGVRESECVCVPSLGDSSNLGHGSSKVGKGSGHSHRSGVGHGNLVTFFI